MARKREQARRRKDGIRPSADDLVEFTSVDQGRHEPPPNRESSYTIIGDSPSPEASLGAPEADADDMWALDDDIVAPAASPAAAAARTESAPARARATNGAKPPSGANGHAPAEAKPASGNVTKDQIESRIQHVIDGLQGIEHLSELVSLRYNPFLEVGEEDVFDGNHLGAAEVVQGHFGGQASAQQYPDFMEVAKVPRHTEPDDLDESIDLTDLPLDHIHSQVGVRPTIEDPVDDVEEETDEPDEPVLAGSVPNPTEGPRGHARKTLLVLAWYRRLQEAGPAPCIYLFIDHCHYLGWIDDEMHTWLEAIAEGLVARDEELTWQGMSLSPLELTNLHEANLLFLDDLFTDHLRLGERRYLSRHINEYFGGP